MAILFGFAAPAVAALLPASAAEFMRPPIAGSGFSRPGPSQGFGPPPGFGGPGRFPPGYGSPAGYGTPPGYGGYEGGPIYPADPADDGPPRYHRRPHPVHRLIPVDDEIPPPHRRHPPRHPVLRVDTETPPPRHGPVRERHPAVAERPPAAIARSRPQRPLPPAPVEQHPPRPALTPVATPVADGSFVPDEILFELRAGQPPSAVDAVARRYRLTPLRSDRIDLLDTTLVRARVAPKDAPGRLVRTLLADPRVAAAQLNDKYRLQAEAPDPKAPEGAAAPSAQWSAVRMHLEDVHKLTTGDKVVVAIIDSGVDVAHPELAGDDVVVVNVLDTAFSAHEHGTAIAGALAAHTQLTGVAPGARLLAIRTFDGKVTEPGAEGTTDFIVKGLALADGQNARIVNLSFAGPADALLSRMLAALRHKGIVIVAAAGNAGPTSPPLYPAADPNVIAVTATDAQDRLYGLANRGPYIRLGAPGVDILEPAPGSIYQLTSGTSIAAAHVTGVIALLLARDPHLDADALKTILAETAEKQPPSQAGGRGVDVVDVLRAVQKIASQAPSPPSEDRSASAPAAMP